MPVSVAPSARGGGASFSATGEGSLAALSPLAHLRMEYVQRLCEVLRGNVSQIWSIWRFGDVGKRMHAERNEPMRHRLLWMGMTALGVLVAMAGSAGAVSDRNTALPGHQGF